MPTPEIPLITERPEEHVFSEVLQQSTGIQPTPANVQPVNDNNGNPVIATPVTQSAKIQLPADKPTLVKWSKGSISDAVTWLGKFFLRIIAKQDANTTNE
jgi:hypothetical protein